MSESEISKAFKKKYAEERIAIQIGARGFKNLCKYWFNKEQGSQIKNKGWRGRE